MKLTAPALKETVLVPYWVSSKLQQLGLSVQELLKPEVMEKHFSYEEAAYVLILNLNETKRMFAVEAPCYAVSQAWSRDAMFFEKVKVIMPIHAPTLVERLFTQIDQNHYTQAYFTEDPCREYTFVTIYPGYFGDTESSSHTRSLLNAVLKECYMYHPYEKVARSKLYEGYFKQLYCDKASV